MQLIFWAAIGVFSQLAFVRLFGTTSGALSFYGNAFFVVAIFALSCGFFAPRLSRFQAFIPLAILGNFLLVLLLGTQSLVQELPDEFQWIPSAMATPKDVTFDLQLGVLLLCTTVVPPMLLIGSKQSSILLARDYQHHGYVLMAVGGIAGGVTFALLNQFVPAQLALIVVWSGAIGIAILRENKGAPGRAEYLVALSVLGLIGASAAYSLPHFWSPYQRVTTEQTPEGDVRLLVNGHYISTVVRRRAEQMHQLPDWQLHTAAFRSLRKGDRVLVLGSGSGTADVREALYRGAGSVTAVEIDPTFVALGTALDPNKTYLDPRVTTHVTDARRFLNTSRDLFDFIYMPFLDSKTLASNQARFRLDSFLYTEEGMRLAHARLADGGVLVVSFATWTPWIRHRMFNLVEQATGAKSNLYLLDGREQTWYVVSKGRPIEGFEPPYLELGSYFRQLPREVVPTDDWPFFYNRDASIPPEHQRLLYVLLVFLAAVFFATRSLAGQAPDAGEPAPTALRAYAAFSGAAFFFIQIRTIAALAPWFGSTYMSQATVIIGIILASLLGTLLAARRHLVSVPVAWGLLLLTIGAGFFVERWFHPATGVVLQSTPLFLAAVLSPTLVAGYLYVSYLQGRSSRAVLEMQWWNLLGGAVGGLSEGVIILIGFHGSLWLVAGFYFMAFVAASLATTRGHSGSVPEENGPRPLAAVS